MFTPPCAVTGLPGRGNETRVAAPAAATVPRAAVPFERTADARFRNPPCCDNLAADVLRTGTGCAGPERRCVHRRPRGSGRCAAAVRVPDSAAPCFRRHSTGRNHGRITGCAIACERGIHSTATFSGSRDASNVTVPDTAITQVAGNEPASGIKPSRTAVKTNETSPSFAIAKKSRVPLAKIDARGAEATRKLGRVFGTGTGRPTQTSTFSSAL